MSARGGLVLCEDGSGLEFLHGLTVKGEIFPFAQNNVVLNGERNGFVGDYRGSEWAGACYSPDGKWLFASIQSPGITFAITGPWKAGALQPTVRAESRPLRAGYFRTRGGMLRVCCALGGIDRPKAFRAPLGSRQLLVTYRKAGAAIQSVG